MSLSLTLAALWAVAATIAALPSMRLQYVPGFALLLLAPAVIVYVGMQHGALLALLGVAAFVSMYRNPLLYFCRRARGEKLEIPR